MGKLKGHQGTGNKSTCLLSARIVACCISAFGWITWKTTQTPAISHDMILITMSVSVSYRACNNTPRHHRFSKRKEKSNVYAAMQSAIAGLPVALIDSESLFGSILASYGQEHVPELIRSARNALDLFSSKTFPLDLTAAVAVLQACFPAATITAETIKEAWKDFKVCWQHNVAPY